MNIVRGDNELISDVDELRQWQGMDEDEAEDLEPLAPPPPFALSPGAPAAQPAADADAISPNADGPFCHAHRPVYEANPDTLLGRQLVMTPWMLLDRLRDCQERTQELRREACERGWGAERRRGRTVNLLTEQLDCLSDDLAHTLYILWRGGLWLDARDGATESRADAKGTSHQVVRAPFTDGKPNGRPLPPDAPPWLCDLLGV